jgi:hypothetical protein
MSEQAEVSGQLQPLANFLQPIPGRRPKRLIPLPPKVRGPVLIGERKWGQNFLIARWQGQVWIFALEHDSQWMPLRYLMPDELPKYELAPKLEIVRQKPAAASAFGAPL